MELGWCEYGSASERAVRGSNCGNPSIGPCTSGRLRGLNELEQMDSGDAPLAVRCLHGGFLVNLVAVLLGKYAGWVGLLALLPLLLLLLTGLYLFVLPYVAKWRRNAAPASVEPG